MKTEDNNVMSCCFKHSMLCIRCVFLLLYYFLKNNYWHGLFCIYTLYKTSCMHMYTVAHTTDCVIITQVIIHCAKNLHEVCSTRAQKFVGK